MSSRPTLIWIIATATFSSCSEREAEVGGFARSFDHLPLVEINDEKIDRCAEAFHYTKTAAELGGTRIRINGHLWVLIGWPMHTETDDLVLDFDPTGFEGRGELERKLRSIDRNSAYVRVQLLDHEPAETLFRILDLLEETGHRYWISPPTPDQVDPANEFKVFVPKEAPAPEGNPGALDDDGA